MNEPSVLTPEGEKRAISRIDGEGLKLQYSSVGLEDTMPGCSAYKCTNRSEKGYKLYRFPSNPERRKIWRNKVNRLNWEPTHSSYLCQVCIMYTFMPFAGTLLLLAV